MQTVISIENNSIPVNIVILPTSLDGKFALCLEINKSSTTTMVNKSNQSMKKNSNDVLLVASQQFKQNFNFALQRALSTNKYSMLSCINLGSLCKIITNDVNNNSASALNTIVQTIKQSVLKGTIITNLENGYFMLLFNSTDKKVVKQNITDIINELNSIKVDINNELIVVNAFAGLVVVSVDSKNPQELMKYVKHASVVAYMNKSKVPEFYQTDEKQHKTSIDESTIKAIKANVTQKKITCYYQGILDTKNNDVKIYRSYSSMNIGQTSYIDNDLELKFSDTDIWGQLDKLKIFQIVKQIENNLAKLNHVIINIGINSIKNIKFVNWLDDLLIKFKIDTSYFIIEVNEYFVIKYKKDIIRLFSELQARGYNSCIGKFGCSLSYKKIITQYDPNFICVDCSFIESIEQDNSEDFKQILDNIKSYGTEIIVPDIKNLKIMQKILEFEINLLSGNYIQPICDTIQTDLA